MPVIRPSLATLRSTCVGSAQCRALPLQISRPLSGVSPRQQPDHASSTTIQTDFSASRFSHKSGSEVGKSLVVLSLCKAKPIVKHANALMGVSRRVLGDRVVNTMLRHTFFKQFCGGETLQEAQATVHKLQMHGVGSVLDYAAESDIGGAQNLTWEDLEPVFEQKLQSTLDTIKLAAEGQAVGYAAAKLTSLTQPELLQRITTVLDELEALWKIVSGSDATDTTQVKVSRDDFCARLSSAIVSIDKAAGEALFEQLQQCNPRTDQKSNVVTYAAWRKFFRPEKYNTLSGVRPGAPSPLTEIEIEQWAKLESRASRMADYTASLGHTFVLVDAEQTYMQTAIDDCVYRQQMRLGSDNILLNTYQAYLKDIPDRLNRDLALAEQQNFKAGAKLVRGAYMFQERRLAKQKNRRSPICDTLDATHKHYDMCVERLLDSSEKCHIFLGTHNENSLKKFLAGVYLRGWTPQDTPVGVGQLLGMCDHVTFTLADKGVRVYKYVPWGPLEMVLPYLIRRAEENSDMLGSSGTELCLLLKESCRRLAGNRPVNHHHAHGSGTAGGSHA